MADTDKMVTSVSMSITDTNGTSITVTEANIWENTFTLTRSASSSEKLIFGEVVASNLEFSLNNLDGTYDSFQFENATITLTVNGNSMGVFIIDTAPTTSDTIEITAMDRMILLDRTQCDFSSTSFPATLKGLCNAIATQAGITLYTQNLDDLPNSTYSVASMPEIEMTARSFFSYAAEIYGCEAIFQTDGKLHFAWYATDSDLMLSTANCFSTSLAENAITIGAVSATGFVDGKSFTNSPGDYQVRIYGNPLVQTFSDAGNVSMGLYGRVGFSYTPISATVLKPIDLDLLTVGSYTDKNSVTHTIACSTITYAMHKVLRISSSGQTSAVNSSKQTTSTSSATVQDTKSYSYTEGTVTDSSSNSNTYYLKTYRDGTKDLIIKVPSATYSLSGSDTLKSYENTVTVPFPFTFTRLDYIDVSFIPNYLLLSKGASCFPRMVSTEKVFGEVLVSTATSINGNIVIHAIGI